MIKWVFNRRAGVRIAGTGIAVCALAMAGAQTAFASSNGDDNKGDVWVDNVGQPAGPGHEQDPHLDCTDVNLWGNALADGSGTYTVDGWAPSGSQEQDYPTSGDGTWTYDGSAGGDQVTDVINVHTLIADAISFGVAPALAIYLWKFEGSRAGWVIALIFAVCMVVRLARFKATPMAASMQRALLSHAQTVAAASIERVRKRRRPTRNWDDQQYFPLYARIQEKKLLALFHTGIASHGDTPQYTSMARMRPSFLDTITRAFPSLYVQGAHFGNPWYDEAAEAARWSPKLFFDLTGSSLIKKENNLAVFKDYLWWKGPTAHSSPQAVYAFEKIVFGTDEPPEQLDADVARYEAMLDACGVPEPSRRKIFGETIATILGIPVRV